MAAGLRPAGPIFGCSKEIGEILGHPLQDALLFDVLLEELADTVSVVGS
jgi:hypothetical protein